MIPELFFSRISVWKLSVQSLKHVNSNFNCLFMVLGFCSLQSFARRKKFQLECSVMTLYVNNPRNARKNQFLLIGLKTILATNCYFIWLD